MPHSHGKQSSIELLTSGLWVLLQIAVLIGGHVLIASHIWLHYQGKDAMQAITKATGLSGWFQLLVMLAAIVLDFWTAYHTRKQRSSSG